MDRVDKIKVKLNPLRARISKFIETPIYSPDRRAELVVLVEWIAFVLVIITMGVIYSQYSHVFLEEFQNMDEDHDSTVTQIVLISVLGLRVIEFFLLIVLSIGVNQRRRCVCKTWYVMGFGSLVLAILSVVYAIFNMDASSSIYIVFPLTWVGFRIYSIRIVYKYTKILSGLVESGQPHAPAIRTGACVTTLQKRSKMQGPK